MPTPSRYVYPERIKSSIWPFLFKLLGVSFFNTSNTQPGSERVKVFEKYLMESDELADKVVLELFGQGKSHKDGFRLMQRIIEQGSCEGLENIPDSFIELMEQANAKPRWLNREKVEKGAAVCRRLGEHAMIALGDMALLGGYANPDISRPLIFTGTLMGNSTFDRLSETSQFWVDVTRKGSLQKGGKGFKICLRVRMMHAMVRVRMMQHSKWNSAAWGLPINRADSLATNVGFSMAMIYGAKRLGFHLPSHEVEAVLHLWKYIGYLMGDDADWLPDTAEEGLQSIMLVTLSNSNIPDEDCKKLAMDYLESFKPKSSPTEWNKFLPEWFVYNKHKAYARYLIPPDLYKNLDIPPVYLSWLAIPLLETPYVFAMDRLRLLLPSFEKFLEEKGGKEQEQIIANRMGDKQASYIPKS